LNIDLKTLPSSNIYHLMTQTIIPRPIAWILSTNQDDTLNLAPFSYFNAVCSDPPLCMISMGKKPSGDQKDTAVNLHLGAFCVVHIAHVGQSEAVTQSAATLDYGESEVDVNKIKLTQQADWPMQRVAGCPIAYLCRVHSTTQIGNAEQQLVFLEALELYLDHSIVSTQNGRIEVDAKNVNPLARLGANQYANLGEVFNNTRPK